MQRSGGQGVGGTGEVVGEASGAIGVVGSGVSLGVAAIFVGVADSTKIGVLSPPGKGLVGVEGSDAVLVELM